MLGPLPWSQHCSKIFILSQTGLKAPNCAEIASVMKSWCIGADHAAHLSFGLHAPCVHPDNAMVRIWTLMCLWSHIEDSRIKKIYAYIQHQGDRCNSCRRQQAVDARAHLTPALVLGSGQTSSQVVAQDLWEGHGASNPSSVARG